MAERVMPKGRVSDGGQYFASAKTDIDWIPSGCKTLDLALGGGGWARRRVANIIGDKSTGKTLLCIEASANFVQTVLHIDKKKPRIRYREAESAFNDLYAEALGMPLEYVDFGDPIDTVEDLFEDLQNAADKSKAPELFIVDSLDALSSRAEMARGVDEASYGTEKARMMSQLFRRLIRACERKDITIIIVSQIRSKIGVTFGRKWTRSGGRALDFYASQVLVLSQNGPAINKTVDKIVRPTGLRLRGKVDKNKVGLPLREAEFDLMFGYGVDDLRACMMYLKDAGEMNAFLDGMKYNAFMQFMRSEATNSEYKRNMADLHKAVERSWWRIEKSFLPTRKKYA